MNLAANRSKRPLGASWRMLVTSASHLLRRPKTARRSNTNRQTQRATQLPSRQRRGVERSFARLENAAALGKTAIFASETAAAGIAAAGERSPEAPIKRTGSYGAA